MPRRRKSSRHRLRSPRLRRSPRNSSRSHSRGLSNRLNILRNRTRRDSMKILVFSDIHEEEAALESLSGMAADYDRVFICGDISQSNLFAESVLQAFPGSLIVPGNWDSERVNGLLKGTPNWVQE